MNPLGLILGGLVVAAVLSGSSSGSGSCSWNDEVGSAHIGALNNQIRQFNKYAEECERAFNSAQNIKPIEFKSRENDMRAIMQKLERSVNGI